MVANPFLNRLRAGDRQVASVGFNVLAGPLAERRSPAPSLLPGRRF